MPVCCSCTSQPTLMDAHAQPRRLLFPPTPKYVPYLMPHAPTITQTKPRDLLPTHPSCSACPSLWSLTGTQGRCCPRMGAHGCSGTQKPGNSPGALTAAGPARAVQATGGTARQAAQTRQVWVLAVAEAWMGGGRVWQEVLECTRCSRGLNEMRRMRWVYSAGLHVRSYYCRFYSTNPLRLSLPATQNTSCATGCRVS